jgi:tellurite methyltransferase
VRRSIDGFHQDAEGDWVAALSCGHGQHVRHRPPLQPRPWVLTDSGRAGRIATDLDCPLCDRAELPAGLRPVRSSPEWTARTMPTSLRRRHRLGPRTWAVVRVRDGNLRFSMQGTPGGSRTLGPGAVQAIPPELDHDVVPIGDAAFTIDFLAVDPDPDRHGPLDDDEEEEEEHAELGGDPACWADRLCPECGAVLDGTGHRAGCSRAVAG